ncbi:site-specific integrase [Enterococcus dispar]|uniref:tyrosine-type recombinase/integrase n=1 Tax=Enterococcus dispar TaxID=44009 RepID=UPI00232E1F1A|nr:site-specific integrase [Enterococcus dispar]WCG34005.1 site-specific integrase [Enterococcus dispar]
MWVEKRTTKTGETAYKYIERYTDPETGKTKKVSIQLAKNSKQAANTAQRELNEKIRKIIDTYEEKKILEETIKNEGIIPNDKTLEDMIREWFELIQNPKSKEYKKGSTISGYSYGVDGLLNEFMVIEKDMLIQDITFEDLQAFYDRMIFDFEYEKSYIKRFRAIIRGAFNLAYKKRYIKNLDAINLSKIITPAKTVEDLTQEQVPKYLEKNEAEQIFEILEGYNPLYTQILKMQYYTGMRFGEVIALEAKNFHDDFLLDIHGTYDHAHRSRTRGQKVPPKTRRSFRTIELGDAPIQILKERMYHNHFLKEKNTDFLFVTANDRPYDLGTINGFINDHHLEFNTSTKVSTHVFRHTHISMLAEKGVPIQVIMDRVGHEDRETTEKIYMHVTRKQKTDLVNTLNEL